VWSSTWPSTEATVNVRIVYTIEQDTRVAELVREMDRAEHQGVGA